MIDSASARQEPQSGASPALWLALAVLHPVRRAAFLDELEAALASLEARHNPLMIDVVQDDPRDVLRRAQPWLLPLGTAATALLTQSYTTPDGYAVDVLPATERLLPGDLPAWGPAGQERLQRLARFLAWPASRSLVLSAPNRQSHSDLEMELRFGVSDPASAVALVLDRALCHGESPDERLREVVRRMSAFALRTRTPTDPELTPVLPTPPADLTPWLALGESELLVVPKLGALSPALRFAREVQAVGARHGARPRVEGELG